ncbi:MAG: hypothetical protein Q9165_003730 [Trypethelium subeluteriae]
MPPSNTPEQSSSNSPNLGTLAARPQTPPSYLSALHELESPVLDLASTLTTTAAEDEADAENVRFLRRLMDYDWPPQGLEVDEDVENETLPQLGDVMTSESRDRILPVPVPEQYRTSEHSTTAQGRQSNYNLTRSNPSRLDPTRRRPDSRRLATEREILEAELQRQRNQHHNRGIQDEEVERVVRLQGILSRLNRLQEPAYGDRIPSQQSLYDWAPANDEDNGEELEDILRDLRTQQPNTHPEILRVLGRSQLDAEREARNRAYSSRFLNSHTASHPQPSESSLRSAAILQSVRRHPRFAARSREHLQRYVMDRERTGHDSEDRDRPSSRWLRTPSLESTRYELNRLAWQTQQRLHDGHSRDPQTRLDALRRGFLDNPSPPNTSSSPFLESAIKYLSRLRDSSCYEQSLSYAVDGGFVTKDFFGDQHDDFILDPESLLPPPPSSWLAPGMVFEGSQHATAVTVPSSYHGQTTSNGHGSNSATIYRVSTNQTVTSSTIDPAISRPSTNIFDASRPWLNHTFTPPPLSSGESARMSNITMAQDTWPVRVTIHAVDFENMTLSGTMEAFNVPSQPPTYSTALNLSSNANPNTHLTFTDAALPTPTSTPFSPFSSSATSSPIPKGTPITTYLDGEILDFTHLHTLQTTSFQSSIPTDACYWRKLPPFSQQPTDEDVVRRLVSKKGFAELRRDWILMRWKERGFVRTRAGDGWGRWTGRATPSSINSVSPSSLQNGMGNVALEADAEAEKGGMENGGAGQGDAMQGHGLTISGFYYVCLRRSDGKVEGLYYDPQSSPYQHLRLSPVRAPGMGLAASGLR